MALLAQVRRKVIATVFRNRKKKPKGIDGQISLGILLRGIGAIAGANSDFLLEEANEIEEILLANTNISKKDLPVVMAAVKQSSFGKSDFYNCVKIIGKRLSFDEKMSIVINLFRVAYADKHISPAELKIIKKVSKLLQIDESYIKRLVADPKSIEINKKISKK